MWICVRIIIIGMLTDCMILLLTLLDLKAALAQIRETNKELESNAERLNMEALACEANYEKGLKEKEL